MPTASLVIVTGMAMTSPSGKLPPTYRAMASPADLTSKWWHHLPPTSGGRIASEEKQMQRPGCHHTTINSSAPGHSS